MSEKLQGGGIKNTEEGMSTRRGFGVFLKGIGGLLQLAGIIGILLNIEWQVKVVMGLVAGGQGLF